MGRIVVRVMTVVFCLTLVASSARAVGLYLYENGTPDLGLAAAGRAALAQEASTVVGNPAGMTRLDRSQLTFSVYTMLPSMQFDRGAGTTFSGGHGFNAGTPTAPFDENFRYGVGLQYDWSDRLTVGAAYEFLDLGEAEIANLRRPAGTLQGEYSSNYVHFVALNVIWKF
jgi:long-subunit fatty acid transport protein